MATLTLQLATVPNNLGPAPPTTPEIDATTTPVNANQAQGAPVPLDTVTLASQSAESQATGQQQQDGEFQSNPAVAAAAALFASAISATSQNGNGASPNQAAAFIKSQRADSANGESESASLTNTIQKPANTARSDLTQSQQQELLRLDDTLRQMGVDPQNVRIFKQLALLFYANNPSGLEQFVRQFQAAAQQNLQQGTVPSLASAQDSAAAALKASASASSAANASASPQLTATSRVFTGSTAASQQFQELQFAVAAVGGQVELPRPPAQADAQEPSLDVTL